MALVASHFVQLVTLGGPSEKHFSATVKLRGLVSPSPLKLLFFAVAGFTTFFTFQSILTGKDTTEHSEYAQDTLARWTVINGSDIWHNLLFQHEEEEEQDSWDGATETADSDKQLSLLPILPVVDAPNGLDFEIPFICSDGNSGGTTSAKYASTPSLLRRSVLHAGSGEDVKRILRRAARLSQAAQAGTNLQENGGDAFRIMILGGSGTPIISMILAEADGLTHIAHWQFQIAEASGGTIAGIHMLSAGSRKHILCLVMAHEERTLK